MYSSQNIKIKNPYISKAHGKDEERGLCCIQCSSFMENFEWSEWNAILNGWWRLICNLLWVVPLFPLLMITVWVNFHLQEGCLSKRLLLPYVSPYPPALTAEFILVEEHYPCVGELSPTIIDCVKLIFSTSIHVLAITVWVTLDPESFLVGKHFPLKTQSLTNVLIGGW